MSCSDLSEEWILMQTQFDSYEKYSLLIKLLSVALVGTAYFFDSAFFPVLFLVLILWFQDGIWKTFQSRIEDRLLEVEKALKKTQETESGEHEQELVPFQFNSEFLKHRRSTAGLVKAYVVQSLRPTVAYPHAALVVLVTLTSHV